MADNLQDFLVTCEGGLDNKNTYLEIAQVTPGAARKLVNFEPGTYGGYRRINGWDPFSETASLNVIDDSNAEGRPLGIFIFQNEVYGARKQKSGGTYKIYQWDDSTGWGALTPGFTLNTTDGTYTVRRISHDILNFDGQEVLILADGVNYAYMFDGSSWTQIKSTNGGTNFADAGGANALDKPSVVEVYQNHLFLSGDPTSPEVVAHSAPSEHYDWEVASGGGQIIPGFTVNQLKVWRDKLIVFGLNNIGNVFVSGTDFVYRDITDNLGCIAPNSVVEVNGDLMFFSQDGIRPIAGTDKIDDFELGTVSKKIQKTYLELISTYPVEDVISCTIRTKNQVRFYFPSVSVPGSDTRGILGGFREKINGETQWEWGETVGLEPWVIDANYLNGVERVVRLNQSASVAYEETGSDFGGSPIPGTYRTSYLHFGEPLIRKSLRRIYAFIEAEGEVEISVAVSFDWGDPDTLSPTNVTLEAVDTNAAIYGNSNTVYDGSGIVYGTGLYPVLDDSIDGSCRSVQLTFTTNDTSAPYSIQSLIFEFVPQGRR